MRDVGKTSIDELIRRGLELHGQGQLVQAEPLYRQALQSAPDHPDSLHLLGVLCGQMRRFEEAQKLIGRAIALYPGVAILHNSLGNVLSDQGKADKSVPCYRKAIELKPDYAEAYYNLGNAWSKQGRLAEASLPVVWQGFLAKAPEFYPDFYRREMRSSRWKMSSLGRWL